MSILNSNDYKRGYQDGFNDGLNDVSKRFSKSGLSWKFAIHGNHAIDTYNKGYNAGYEKGCYDRMSKANPQSVTIESKQTNSFNSNNIKSNSMQRGIDGQIDLLGQMKNFISNLADQFEDIIKTQEGFVRGLDSEGLDYKILQKFEESVLDNRNKITSLIRDIEDEQIPYIDNVIRHLEETP